jgi:hypothetical protein
MSIWARWLKLDKRFSRPTGRQAHNKPAKRRDVSRLLVEQLESRLAPSVSGLNITSITSAADTDGNATDEHVSVQAGSVVTVNFDYTTAGGSGTTTKHAEIWNTTFSGSALVTGVTNNILAEGDGSHSGFVTVDTTGLAPGNYGVRVLVTHKGNGTDSDPNSGEPDSGITILSATITVTPDVSLNAPDAEYSGAAYADANATTDPDVSAFGTTSVRYYATSGDAAADTNAISAPKNVGTYYARAFYVSDGLDHGGTIYQDASSEVVSFQITAKHITGSFTAANKPYDGNNSATVLTTDPGSIVAGDDVTLNITDATFSDKNVADGKTVTANTFNLSGADAGNYVLDSVATTTADITALHITGSFTAADKLYDGNTSATITGRSLNGAIGGDDVSLIGGTASFASPNPGTWTVTGTGFSLSGVDAGNYVLDSVATTTATISFPTGGFSVDTQAALNTYKSGDIVTKVTALGTDDLATLQALASGGYSFRYVFTDAKATVTVDASLAAGSYTGAGDWDFALTYRNPGATSPLNALVTAANTSASTGVQVTCSAQVNIGGTWYELGSDAIKAFLSKK